ncbi:hypothetical protein BS50DRAFT_232750 [Corynespora cassiicola Philippines]|uniref:Uncharacterized protein n=1 Tax=Corynespora cassiicola Philippines TaxID=1448308 RepID=A0A2T2P1T9_CORCC|nr:hypothetical protein BS50DRAFT_232750 [Corynespora cassiicola Philippines]
MGPFAASAAPLCRGLCGSAMPSIDCFRLRAASWSAEQDRSVGGEMWDWLHVGLRRWSPSCLARVRRGGFAATTQRRRRPRTCASRATCCNSDLFCSCISSPLPCPASPSRRCGTGQA